MTGITVNFTRTMEYSAEFDTLDELVALINRHLSDEQVPARRIDQTEEDYVEKITDYLSGFNADGMFIELIDSYVAQEQGDAFTLDDWELMD